MTPFYFGAAPRLLFGVLHTPASREALRGAVLICSPFGQEAIQAHRILRALGTRLSKSGFFALRFNYFATGDSAGDSHEGSRSQWVADVHTAHAELARRSGVSRIAWVGLRYGASLATLAAESIPADLSELVLWDPVVRGKDYLSELHESHASFMREDLEGWTSGSSAGKEALGFPLVSPLVDDLGSLDLVEHCSVRSRRVTLIESSPTAPLDDLERSLKRRGVSSQALRFDGSSTWNSDEAMNTFYVPAEILNAIVSCIREAT